MVYYSLAGFDEALYQACVKLDQRASYAADRTADLEMSRKGVDAARLKLAETQVTD